MHRTNIEWTDLAANPLQYRDKGGKVVWGCVKHSTGCAHCYSEQMARRVNRGSAFTAANMRDLTPFLGEKELRHILTARVIEKQVVAGSRCLIGDMTDVFGEWVPDELLDRLFAVLALRPDVTFQVLTKRADRMAAYLNRPDLGARLYQVAEKALDAGAAGILGRAWDHVHEQIGDFVIQLPHRQFALGLPLRNVWFGASVENQAAANERVPHMLQLRAAVKFLSCEPLLGPVDISRWIGRGPLPYVPQPSPNTWVIVGCESGPGRRETQAAWTESLVEQCRAAGVRCFVKQVEVGGKVCGDADQFPQQLRVRAYPPVPA